MHGKTIADEARRGGATVADHRELLAAIRGVEAMVEAAWRPAPGDVARRLGALEDQVRRYLVAMQSDSSPSVCDASGYRALVGEIHRLAAETEQSSCVTFDSMLGVAIGRVLADLRTLEAASAGHPEFVPVHSSVRHLQEGLGRRVRLSGGASK